MAVFLVKIEPMPLKSDFEARLVPSGGSKIRKTSAMLWFSSVFVCVCVCVCVSECVCVSALECVCVSVSVSVCE